MGGGAKKTKKPSVQHAAPLDFGQIMAQGNAAAAQSYKDQLAAQIAAYPQLEALQLGTVQKLADNLNNQYTRQATDAVNAGLDQRGNITGEADRLSDMGGLMGDFALQNYLTSGPTAAEQNIQTLGQSAMGVRADQIVAPGQDAVRNVQAASMQAGQVGAGQIGDALMAQALQRAQSDGRLGAEAERDAAQAARASMAARGLGTGGAATAAELLNRDRFARSRQAEDLTFAQGVQQQDVARQFQNVANRMTASQTNAQLAQQAALANQSRDQFLAGLGMDAQQANQAANMNQREMNRAFMLNANQAFNQGTLTRRDQAAQQAALSANMMQGAAGMYGNAANIGFAGAQNLISSDPYQRALGVGLQSAGNTQANLQSGIGQTYGNALGMAGNTASFNANLIQSQANTQLNNWAAMNAAQMQAGALGQQGMMGMAGGIGGGLLIGAGLAI